MNKKIITTLIMLVMLATTSASFAETSFWDNIINANKKVLNDAASAKQTQAQTKINAKIAQYEKQIAAKQTQITKVKDNQNYTFSEKYKKIKTIRADIKELKAAIKDLK